MTHDQHLPQILANEKSRWEWIKYQLCLQGSSIAKVAQAIPTRPTYLHKLKTLQCPRYEIKLAEALNMTPQSLFPDRYDEQGLPRRGRSGVKKANGSKLPKRPAARNLRKASGK